MKKTKMTVRIPQDLFDNFRRYTEEQNTTMSSLIEAYLRRVPPQELTADAPITRRLSGILSQQVNIEDYKEHLVEKCGS